MLLGSVIFIFSVITTILYRKWKILLYERFNDILFILGLDIDEKPNLGRACFLLLHATLIIIILYTTLISINLPLIIFSGILLGQFPSIRVVTLDEWIERQNASRSED